MFSQLSCQLLGMYTFGLEEAGDYRQAETIGRRSVELDAMDGVAAHVLEMEGREQEGVDWLEETSKGSAEVIHHEIVHGLQVRRRQPHAFRRTG